MTLKKNNQGFADISKLWTECGNRDLLNDPPTLTALGQLRVDPYNQSCLKFVHMKINAYDKQEALHPEPFRKTNPKTKNTVSGPIHLGIVNHSQVQYGIHSNSLPRHLLIAGITGGGKSTIISHIIKQLVDEKIMIIVPDRKMDFYKIALNHNFLYLLHNDFHDNWLKPPNGVDADLWYNILAEILATHFELRIGAQALLVDILTDLTNKLSVYPTLHDLIKRLNEIAYSKRNSNKEVALRLSFRLKWLLTTLGNNVASRKTPDWSKLMNTSWAFSIAGLASSIQTLCVTIYFAKVLLYRICNNLRSDDLASLFILDEASMIFPKSSSKKTSLLLDYFQQARAFGLGVIVASQSMNLAPEIYANTGTKICVGGFGYGSDYAEFASAIGLNKEKSDFMRTISQPGSAIVKDPRYPLPFSVQIERSKDD